MRSLRTMLAAYAVLWAVSTMAAPAFDGEAHPTVNLARLRIARVFAKGWGCDRLFDPSSTVAPTTGACPWWFRVSFTRPVTIVGIEFDAIRRTSQRPAEAMVTWGGGSHDSATVPVRETAAGYALELPRPASGVTAVRVDLGNQCLQGLAQARVIGLPPRRASLEERTPPRDVDFALQLAKKEHPDEMVKEAQLRRRIPRQLAEMQRARADLDAAVTDPDRAAAWLQLNRAALAIQNAMHAHAQFLGNRQILLEYGIPPVSLEDHAAEMNALGIRVQLCEVGGGDLAVGAEGYGEYLRLWPDGPDADEAFWFGRIHLQCMDNEAETAPYYWVGEYHRFLKRWPESRFAPQARSQIAANCRALSETPIADASLAYVRVEDRAAVAKACGKLEK